MGRICCDCSQATAVSAAAVVLRRTDMAQSSLDGEPSCCREACSRRFELQKVARRRGEESQDLQPARSESRIEQNMGSHGVGGRQRRQQGDSTSPTLDTAGNSDAIIPLWWSMRSLLTEASRWMSVEAATVGVGQVWLFQSLPSVWLLQHVRRKINKYKFK
jgi:hypothetical protein